MNPKPVVLTINGGSSSIKFALFDRMDPGEPRKRLSGEISRIGLDRTAMRIGSQPSVAVHARSHRQAAEVLADWLKEEREAGGIGGIGHRVVHGGLRRLDHQLIDESLVEDLKKTQPLDLAHLPREISLIEFFREAFPTVGQVACLDTAFHRDLPQVARRLPIPRSYDEAGVRRFGFHGLSYSYLMEELNLVGGEATASGRIILAHLGSGASMAAVKDKRPIDTSMAFTPTAGLVMGTRPGDLDPGLLVYLMRVEKMSPAELDKFISSKCGLLGIAESSSDMRDLIDKLSTDNRAAEAVDLFCYQAKKFVGAYAAALGGLDTLVFAGGIGEHSPEVRQQICEGLDFLGIKIEPEENQLNGPVISSPGSQVCVRVISTDEEVMIARLVCRLVKPV